MRDNYIENALNKAGKAAAQAALAYLQERKEQLEKATAIIYDNMDDPSPITSILKEEQGYIESAIKVIQTRSMHITLSNKN